MRAALGGEPALARPRTRTRPSEPVDRVGQREVRAQPVVAAPVVELGPRPAGTARRCAARAWCATATCRRSRRCAARTIARRRRRAPASGTRASRRAARATGPDSRPSTVTDSGRSTTMSSVGGRVVVGVAAVTAVDEAAEPGDRARRRGRRSSRCRRSGRPRREVLVGELVLAGARPRCVGPVAVDRARTCAIRSRAPAPARTTTSRIGASAPGRNAIVSRLAQREQLARAARSRSIAGSPGRRRAACTSTTPSSRSRSSTRAIARARELRAAHHLEHPPDLLADDDGGEARRRPTVRTTCVGQAVPSSRATRCTGPVARAATRSISPPRSTAGRVDDDGRRRRRVDLGGERVRAPGGPGRRRCGGPPGSAPRPRRRPRRRCTRTTSRGRC